MVELGARLSPLPRHSTPTAVVDAHAHVRVYVDTVWGGTPLQFTSTHMGSEGATWLGQAPFSKTPHCFANMGDGTYMHSGSLAIRQAIASGSNVTYKILYVQAHCVHAGCFLRCPQCATTHSPSPTLLLQCMRSSVAFESECTTRDCPLGGNFILPGTTTLLR